MNYFKILQESEYFNNIQSSQILEFYQNTKFSKLNQFDFLFQKGDKSNFLYFILDGSILLNSEEEFQLKITKKNFMLGFFSAYLHQRKHYSC